MRESRPYFGLPVERPLSEEQARGGGWHSAKQLGAGAVAARDASAITPGAEDPTRIMRSFFLKVPRVSEDAQAVVSFKNEKTVVFVLPSTVYETTFNFFFTFWC